MKSSREYIKPVVILALICLAVGILLSAVNSITAPIIAANEEAETLAAYYAVLPEADSFTELECDIDGVTAVMKADNGCGYVVLAESRGYGGMVPAAVSFDNDGSIIRVSMMDNDETPGLGQKVLAESFSGQFSGMTAENFEIGDIDAITGATYSSRAAVNAINLAIDAYHQATGGEAQ